MLISLIQEEQIHREVYVAVLNSALRKPGSKARFAGQIGISPQYLSYLLNPDALDPVSFRRPSQKIARDIARNLPLDAELRDSLLEHMLAANLGRSRMEAALRAPLSEEEIEASLEALRIAHGAATHSRLPATARAQYRTLRDAGYVLLQRLSPQRHPLALVELCFLLHDTQCVLNRPDEALYLARRARILLDGLGTWDVRGQRERLGHFQVQALRAESVAYYNLGLFRPAYERSLQAEATDAMKYQRNVHLPHVYRDRIQALIGQPRFTLGEASGLAYQVIAVCQQQAGELDPLWELMIRRALGRAYLHHGSLKQASSILLPQIEHIERIPYIGPLHQAMYLKICAMVRWQVHDYDEWEFLSRRTLEIAFAAGLTHQIRAIRQAFGSAIDSMLQAYESSLGSQSL